MSSTIRLLICMGRRGRRPGYYGMSLQYRCVYIDTGCRQSPIRKGFQPLDPLHLFLHPGCTVCLSLVFSYVFIDVFEREVDERHSQTGFWRACLSFLLCEHGATLHSVRKALHHDLFPFSIMQSLCLCLWSSLAVVTVWAVPGTRRGHVSLCPLFC